MKTSRYYAGNAEARAKKAEYDTEYHSTRQRKKYRAFLIRRTATLAPMATKTVKTTTTMSNA